KANLVARIPREAPTGRHPTRNITRIEDKRRRTRPLRPMSSQCLAVRSGKYPPHAAERLECLTANPLIDGVAKEQAECRARESSRFSQVEHFVTANLCTVRLCRVRTA